MENILKEIENFARQNKIPVILPKTQEFLKEICKKHQPKQILEIGTAIGFSASLMLLNCGAFITCAEASAPNIKLAKQNFERLNLTSRVNIVEGDCLNTLPKLIGKKFDLIFLDGPKGLYPQILNLLLPLLAKDGILVADNVEFRGMVSLGAEITEHRFEKTVFALREFIENARQNKNLKVCVYPEIGDGILVAKNMGD